MLRGRLAVVPAAAGYGKTDAVRGWLRDELATWNPEPARAVVLTAAGARTVARGGVAGWLGFAL